MMGKGMKGRIAAGALQNNTKNTKTFKKEDVSESK